MILTANTQRQALILLTFRKEALNFHGNFSSAFSQHQQLGGIKGASSPAGLSGEGSVLCAASGPHRIRWHYLSGQLWGVGVLSLSKLHLNCSMSSFVFSWCITDIQKALS